MSNDSKYIYDLIEEGEHQKQDFKFEITNARKIAKTLVAFANTDGGRLLIGVKDNGRIAGVRSDEEYYMIEAAASIYCKPEVKFESFSRIVDTRTVLEIVVNPSKEKPHFAEDENKKWLAYHRVRDNNFLADFILLQLWKREKRIRGTFITYSEKEKKVLKILHEKGRIDISGIQKEINLRKKELQYIMINLISLQAVHMEFEEADPIFSIEE